MDRIRSLIQPRRRLQEVLVWAGLEDAADCFEDGTETGGFIFAVDIEGRERLEGGAEGGVEGRGEGEGG